MFSWKSHFAGNHFFRSLILETHLSLSPIPEGHFYSEVAFGSVSGSAIQNDSIGATISLSEIYTRISKQLSFFQMNVGPDPRKTRRRPEEEAAAAAGRSPGKLS